MSNYRICTLCAIHHYENCGSCFGFGVYEGKHKPDGLIPVTANIAIGTKDIHKDILACPECGSTELGMPA